MSATLPISYAELKRLDGVFRSNRNLAIQVNAIYDQMYRTDSEAKKADPNRGHVRDSIEKLNPNHSSYQGQESFFEVGSEANYAAVRKFVVDDHAAKLQPLRNALFSNNILLKKSGVPLANIKQFHMEPGLLGATLDMVREEITDVRDDGSPAESHGVHVGAGYSLLFVRSNYPTLSPELRRRFIYEVSTTAAASIGHDLPEDARDDRFRTDPDWRKHQWHSRIFTLDNIVMHPPYGMSRDERVERFDHIVLTLTKPSKMNPDRPFTKEEDFNAFRRQILIESNKGGYLDIPILIIKLADSIASILTLTTYEQDLPPEFRVPKIWRKCNEYAYMIALLRASPFPGKEVSKIIYAMSELYHFFMGEFQSSGIPLPGGFHDQSVENPYKLIEELRGYASHLMKISPDRKPLELQEGIQLTVPNGTLQLYSFEDLVTTPDNLLLPILDTHTLTGVVNAMRLDYVFSPLLKKYQIIDSLPYKPLPVLTTQLPIFGAAPPKHPYLPFKDPDDRT